MGYGSHIVPELAEAAARTGDVKLLTAVLEWLSERTRVTPTDWVLGIEARARALHGEGEAAERRYRESIEHLGRTRVRTQLARSHLLYGEWLRRENRRADARDQLRTAHQMLEAMGAAEPVKLNETSGGWFYLTGLLGLDGGAGLVDPHLGGQGRGCRAPAAEPVRPGGEGLVEDLLTARLDGPGGAVMD